MNNKDKAKQLAIQSTKDVDDNGNEVYNAFVEAALLEMAQWKDEQAKQLHKIIIKLWDMLDWIDTYADLKINGSENDVYFSKIENKTKERFAFVKSDGYDLFINDEKITNNEHNTTKTD